MKETNKKERNQAPTPSAASLSQISFFFSHFVFLFLVFKLYLFERDFLLDLFILMPVPLPSGNTSLIKILKEHFSSLFSAEELVETQLRFQPLFHHSSFFPIGLAGKH